MVFCFMRIHKREGKIRVRLIKNLGIIGFAKGRTKEYDTSRSITESPPYTKISKYGRGDRT